MDDGGVRYPGELVAVDAVEGLEIPDWEDSEIWPGVAGDIDVGLGRNGEVNAFGVRGVEKHWPSWLSLNKVSVC